ncbi:hypothetical protein [Haloglycomyces albus]|uniref:hypothetical protein n=1 Tax=Haloglycomyces albus TaxID=526067 RepID=UPI00046D5194|nr:hypothetical protein [Haloglycomyces albus]
MPQRPHPATPESVQADFQQVVSDHYDTPSDIADDERHQYLFQHLADSDYHDWAEIGRRLASDRIQLWDLAFAEPYVSIVFRGLEANLPETKAMLDVISRHLTEDATALSRARSSHPDFDPDRQHDLAPSTSEADPPDGSVETSTTGAQQPSKELSAADLIRSHAYRDYGMSGNGDQSVFATSLLDDPDPLLRSLGRAILDGTLQVADVPDHPQVQHLATDYPDTAAELFQRILDYLYVPEPEAETEDWGTVDHDDDPYADDNDHTEDPEATPEPEIDDDDDFELKPTAPMADTGIDRHELRDDPWGIRKSEEYE